MQPCEAKPLRPPNTCELWLFQVVTVELHSCRISGGRAGGGIAHRHSPVVPPANAYSADWLIRFLRQSFRASPSPRACGSGCCCRYECWPYFCSPCCSLDRTGINLTCLDLSRKWCFWSIARQACRPAIFMGNGFRSSTDRHAYRIITARPTSSCMLPHSMHRSPAVSCQDNFRRSILQKRQRISDWPLRGPGGTSCRLQIEKTDESCS